MRIYIAGRPPRLEEFRAAASDLVSVGHEVTSSWMFNEDDTEVTTGAPLTYGSAEANNFATTDLKDISGSDCLINFTEDRAIPQRGGGRFVEVGFALGIGLQVITVGPVEVIFLGLTQCFDTWAQALEALT